MSEVEEAGEAGCWRGRWWVGIFGVVFPLVCVVVEVSTGICAEVFFDPLPTVFHVVGYLWISVANGWALLVCGQRGLRSPVEARWPLLANGAALAVALVYSVLFLPLLPLSPFGLMMMGLGACVWSPYLAVGTTLACLLRLRRCAGHAGATRFTWAWGMGLMALLALLVSTPRWVTYAAVVAACEEPGPTQAAGVRTLRAIGSEKALLKMCYESGRPEMAFSGVAMSTVLGDVSPREAREVFYRVTGESFNDRERPQGAGIGRRGRLFAEDWDEDQGGGKVGARVADLRLAESRLDGSFDGDGALGYLEWTMVFENDSTWRAHEARAQVQLPSGAVVSRLTLWVNGEEREAAFAGRGKVRAAYEEVAIRQQRDPVLITTLGPERILMQCFPVPEQGRMQIRFGISMPLTVTEADACRGGLPRILEHNFTMAEEFDHQVWLAAQGRLASALPALTAEKSESAGQTTWRLRGGVSQADLGRTGAGFGVDRDPVVRVIWGDDERAGAMPVVVQEIGQVKQQAVEKLHVVVDGSRQLRSEWAAMAEVLESNPLTTERELFFAGDEVARLPRLKAGDFVGGRDSLPALLAAWDAAANDPGAAILWIHAAQPVLLSAMNGLEQRWDRQTDGPVIYAFGVGAGPNRIVEAAGDRPQFEMIGRLGPAGTDLASWLGGISGEEAIWQTTRQRQAQRPEPDETVAKTSGHLARLLAYDEILGGLATGTPAGELIAKGQAYQLVTPVTGAVVLETAAQFEQNGLEPVPPESVPSIPEPGTWALLICAAALLVWSYRRRQSRMEA